MHGSSDGGTNPTCKGDGHGAVILDVLDPWAKIQAKAQYGEIETITDFRKPDPNGGVGIQVVC